MLEESARGVGISKARLMLQLSKEYGVPVDTISKLSVPTEDNKDHEAVDRLAEQLEGMMKDGETI